VNRPTTRFNVFHINCVTHTHTRLTALFPGLPGWAGTRKVKPVWILLKQETVSGSGHSWAICKSAPAPDRQLHQHPTTQFFYRPDALPAAQPTASKHWRQIISTVSMLWKIYCQDSFKGSSTLAWKHLHFHHLLFQCHNLICRHCEIETKTQKYKTTVVYNFWLTSEARQGHKSRSQQCHVKRILT